MAEAKNKYGAIAELKQPRPVVQQHTETEEPREGVFLPEKPKRQGKRSDPAWKQYSVLLKKESHKEAGRILQHKYEGNDISDLMQALLEQWIKSQS